MYCPPSSALLVDFPPFPQQDIDEYIARMITSSISMVLTVISRIE